MRFNTHSRLEGRHAFLSPSKHHWINYDDEKMLDRYDNHMTAALGTRLHAFAAEAIRLGRKQPNNTQTLNMYVNDAIGYYMEPEVSLFYSDNAFGTADAIGFDEETLMLRIFDLKNGTTRASEVQLEVYAALFCLEYKMKPGKIGYDLRLYQNDDVAEFHTDPEDIAYIMSRIQHFDQLIESAREV